MIRSAIAVLRQLAGPVINHSVGLFYGHWTHRYLLYLAVFMLIGIWTLVALEIYSRLTWRATSVGFRGNYILHTMINFGICLYVADEWVAQLTGRWGQFANRTLGKQALIWGMSFIAAFCFQRTVVFEGMKYYSLDVYHYFEIFPQMRPRPLEHFLFCVPFLIGTIILLWLMTIIRQHGLKKEQKALESLEQTLLDKNRALRDKVAGDAAHSSLPPLCVQSGSRRLILDQGSIIHVTVEDHYCRIHTLEEDKVNNYFVKSSLADLLEKLDEDLFIRIHRSHVVNARAIRQLDTKNRGCRVYLKSDTVLPVSRHRLDEVMARIREVLELLDN